LALLGLAALFDARWRSAAIIGLTGLVATVSLSLPSDPAAFGFIENLRYFTVFFFAGVLAYLIRMHLVITGFALLPLFALFALSARTPFAEVGAALFLGYGALWAATKTWGPLRRLCNRFDTSFGIYIFAGPIQQALLWLDPTLPPLAIALIAFALVLPLAFASWIFIEKPSLRARPFVTDLFRKIQPQIAQPAG
jgi:peptidoglycan/LPS O-acetylase OafA/YrhL